MEFLNELQTAAFWTGLLAIIWVNIILSGDNAVVIALAARSLPAHQQSKAVFWGAGAAVLLRIILTIFAVALLKYPYLKLVGGALLFWIAVKLLVPEDDGGADVHSSDNLYQAIKTILIADLVMSLDNVVAVAAVAKGSILLLILGLAISIPLVVFGATILMKLMGRYPVIVTIGAALIGYVAGEMLVTDPVAIEWFKANAHWLIDFELVSIFGAKLELSAAGLIGAAMVVAFGKWLAARGEREKEAVTDLAAKKDGTGATRPEGQIVFRVLLATDGSENSLRAAKFLIGKAALYSESLDVHLLNVQPAFPGTVRGVHEQAQRVHQAEGEQALVSVRKLLDDAGVKYTSHIGVGEASEVVAHYVREKKIEQIVMGTHGRGAVAGLLLGSVATQVINSTEVPVLLVK